MASRLYRTTRPLYLEVIRQLRQLGIGVVGTPSTFALIALYISGLILLDRHPTQTRVSRFLPARCHDAINRLLRVMALSSRALMGSLISWVMRRGVQAHLCLDDVVIEKAFAKRLVWAGWTYSFAKKRKVHGLHVVVLLWCSGDGRWRIPVAFRLWRPKHSCRSHAFRTKLQLAEAILKEVLGQGLHWRYIVFDTHYTAGWFTKVVGRLGLTWVGTLNSRTIVYWRGRRQSVRGFAGRLPLRWRSRLGCVLGRCASMLPSTVPCGWS